MNDDIDALIAKVIDWDTAAPEEALIAIGPAAAKRVFDLYYGQAHAKIPTKVTNARLLMDGWSAALNVAASIAPEEFLSRLRRKVDLTEIGILGHIDDPRATKILCAQLKDKDWLHRANALSALAEHSGPEVRQAFERALDDPHGLIRSQAIEFIAESDPERGIMLYEAYLRDPGLSPLLRQGAENALSRLRDIEPGVD
jgi:HEAT repeat protein